MENELLRLDSEQRSVIADNLSRLIALKKTTESKVAQELDIPVMTVRRLLSGETTDPRVFTLKALADHFNVSLDRLIQSNAIGPNEHLSQSKPIFIPVLDWEFAKNRENIDLKQWSDWIPITVGKNENIGLNAFALESRPSMYPRFQPGTLFVLDPDLTPTDGDLVLLNLLENNELTLRELLIDPPDWQFHPLTPGVSILPYVKERHKVIAVVFLTLFYNRKTRPLHAEK